MTRAEVFAMIFGAIIAAAGWLWIDSEFHRVEGQFCRDAGGVHVKTSSGYECIEVASRLEK